MTTEAVRVRVLARTSTLLAAQIIPAVPEVLWIATVGHFLRVQTREYANRPLLYELVCIWF